MSNNPQQDRQQVYDYCRAMLGDGMIDVELDPIHYETALDRALTKFRQRSPNSVEESYCFLTLEKDKNDYILPQEIVNVQSVFRRTLGSRTGGGTGTNFEPFNLAYTNTYLLNSTMLGGISTYFLFASYQEMVGKMFGSFINFDWNSTTKKLRISQRPQGGDESVLLWMYNHRPDFNLLQDNFAGIWIKDYALANAKIMLGEAREKFSQIAGPQGGVQLNGATLKSEGQAMIEKLDLELINNFDNQKPLTFVIG